MRTKENSEWRVSSRKSLCENRFYVDWVSDERWGKLKLVADDLTEAEAIKMASDHNKGLNS